MDLQRIFSAFLFPSKLSNTTFEMSFHQHQPYKHLFLRKRKVSRTLTPTINALVPNFSPQDRGVTDQELPQDRTNKTRRSKHTTETSIANTRRASAQVSSHDQRTYAFKIISSDNHFCNFFDFGGSLDREL